MLSDGRLLFGNPGQALLVLAAPEEAQESVASALAADDECLADGTCALSALQRRALKMADLDAKADLPGDCGEISDFFR